MKTPLILSAVLAGLMAGQSALGLLFPAAYRDSAWIRAAWYGNDWVTLAVAVAGVQAALYLLVLSVNSAVGIDRGLEEAPGELPVWGPLATTTAAAVYLLLKDVRPEGEEIP